MNEHVFLTGLNDLQTRMINLCRSILLDEKAFINAKDFLQRLALCDFGMDEDDFEDECEALTSVVYPMADYPPESVGYAYRVMLQMGLPWRCRYPHFDLRGMIGDFHDEVPFGPESVELRLSRYSQRIMPIDKNPLLPMSLLNGVLLPDGSEIPPHNLEELWMAMENLRQNPDIALEDLMEILPGPDFPSCGIVGGIEAIQALYKNGKEALTLRGEIRTEIEGGRTRIAITSLPHGVLIKTVLDQIQALRKKEVLPLYDLKNISEGQSVRIVLDTSAAFSARQLRDLLFRETDLERTVLFRCSDDEKAEALLEVLKKASLECPPAWERKDGQPTTFVPFIRDVLCHGGYKNPLSQLTDERRTRILQIA